MRETSPEPGPQAIDEGFIATWRQQAACRSAADPNIFFPEQESVSTDSVEAMAKAICARCGVVPECLDYALRTNEKDGVWGGLNKNERAALRRRHLDASRRNRG